MSGVQITAGQAGDSEFQQDFARFLQSEEMQRVLREEAEANAKKAVRRKQKFVARELAAADDDTRRLVGPFVQMPFVADLLVKLCDDLRDGRPLKEKLREPRLRQLFERLADTARNEGNDLTRVQEEWYHACLNAARESQRGRAHERARMGPDTLVPMMNAASACKADGNRAFCAGRMREALDCYTKGVEALVPVRGSSAADSAVVDELFVALLLNQAAAALKVDEFLVARDAAQRALEMRPDSVKALFRHGVAAGKLHDVDAARKSLRRALEIDPSCTDATRALEQLDADVARWSSDERDVCRRMFH